MGESCAHLLPGTRGGLGLGVAAIGAGHVDDDSAGFVLFFEDDGPLGIEQLVGDVAEDGSASRRDAAFGDQGKQAGEEGVDLLGGGEFGDFVEEVGGKIFGVAWGG